MWTQEREVELLEAVGVARPVSQEVVASAAVALDVSTARCSSPVLGRK